ncbi:unannotated protein [freshwater metagenome]|uniref:Unannotated protein n=1 Tax=freshwater metagenome TaxID=449393 RepID=A0A6J7DTE4_9ZZZZ
MHPALEQGVPGKHGNRDVDPRRREPTLLSHGVGGDADQGKREPGELEVVGVEDRDDADCAEVVDHGQGQEEGTEGDRQPPADDGKDGQGKGDIGRHRDAPAGRQPPGHRGVEHQEDERRNDHAAERGRDRHGGARGPGKRPDHELVLEFEADHEEEHGEQPVGGPGSQREMKSEVGRPHRVGNEVCVARGPRGVGPDQRDGCSDEQQPAADGLLS